MQWFLLLAMLGGVIQSIREEKPEYLLVVAVLGVVAFVIHVARKREVQEHAKTVATELHNLAKSEPGPTDAVLVPVPIPVPVQVPVPVNSEIVPADAKVLSNDNCRVCGSRNQEGWKYCSACSAPRVNPSQCPQCKHINLEGWMFCSDCGKAR
jgi:hypothetical protein